MIKRHKEKRPKKLFGAMADRRTESSPSFTRILSRHGLCSPDMRVPDVFALYLRIGADSVVSALKPRTATPRTNVLGIYWRTAAALEKMNKEQLAALRERFS